MVRYFVFTLHLATVFSLAFNGINALHRYVLISNTDVFNTVLAIFVNIAYGLGLMAIWVRTYQSRPRLC